MPLIFALIVALIVVVAAVAGAVFGAIGGYIVGWLFDETSIKVLTFAGLQSFEMWEVGAVLGFLGGFFRASVTTEK